MKNRNQKFVLLLLLAFTACKKEAIQKPAPVIPVVINALTDSVSYTIDGTTYTGVSDANSFSDFIGVEETNRKVVYTNINSIPGYDLPGSPDSVLFYYERKIISNSAKIGVYFITKFRKKNKSDGLSYNFTQDEFASLFTVGNHPYAEDFEWQNTQNGIAIDLTSGTTYNGYNGVNTIVLQPGFQKNFTFDIVSFTKLPKGGYNFKAKFTAIVFDNTTGEQKMVDNGYLQLFID